MSRKLEDFYPPIREDGIVTDKNITTAGNLSVTGTSTFTGVATFSAAPVFNGGRTANVTSLTAATAAPTAANSGTTYVFNKADGVVVTLPVPVVGLEYSFIVGTTITSNSYKVITDAGTTLLSGSILGSVTNTANKSWVGDGSTHLAVTQAAASTNATGGIIGSWVRFMAISTTQWNVVGLTVAGGTPTTPFATS